jgi:4-hydroxybenzoate polyprenyltransferase
MALRHRLLTTLDMIKWTHSIFALPFALTGAMLAAGGWPTLRQTFWIIVCMVSARSAAMAFNRLVDARYDATNPRTRMRPIPAGTLTPAFAAGFTLACTIIFLIAAGMLNHLTLLLSPIVLIVLFGYSYCKRFTRLAHLALGVSLGMAPSAAWIAVRGSLDPRILLLTLAVIFWVTGFDLLYACQDVEHDRREGLYSFPARFGMAAAFLLARTLHVGMLLLLLVVMHLFHLGWPAAAGVAATALLLLYEHSIISPRDISRMNAAFFTMNGIISVVYFLSVAASLLLH